MAVRCLVERKDALVLSTLGVRVSFHPHLGGSSNLKPLGQIPLTTSRPLLSLLDSKMLVGPEDPPISKRHSRSHHHVAARTATVEDRRRLYRHRRPRKSAVVETPVRETSHRRLASVPRKEQWKGQWTGRVPSCVIAPGQPEAGELRDDRAQRPRQAVIQWRVSTKLRPQAKPEPQRPLETLLGLNPHRSPPCRVEPAEITTMPYHQQSCRVVPLL